MGTRASFKVNMLAMGLMAMPTLALAQQQEHRELDLQAVPSPLEAIRGIQNAGRMIFMLADTNHDGQISQKEAIDANNLMVGGFFFEADADGNGSVSADEAKTIREEYFHRNPWMRYAVESLQAQRRGQQNNSQPNPLQAAAVLLDSNNDKQIQARELRQIVQTATQTYFAAADTNHDGQLNPSEINAAAAGAVRSVSQLAFQQADSDNNGQLSRDEYDKSIVQPANAVFQIMDLNHDGQLSTEEAQRTAQGLAGQFRVLNMPEPANSPTNLIESGRMPREAAPVPSFSAPNGPQNRQQRQSNQSGQPSQPAQPPR